jgi:hypothetical protein
MTSPAFAGASAARASFRCWLAGYALDSSSGLTGVFLPALKVTAGYSL